MSKVGAGVPSDLISIFTAALCGCASNLKVYADESGTRPIAGLPIHTPELYVRRGTYHKATKGGECDPTAFPDFVSLPVGRTYYVNVDTAEFAKTEFAVKWAESGNVSEITITSEPSTGEALKNAGELVGSIAPLLGVSAAQAIGKSPPCDAGPDIAGITYERFADWQERGRQ